MKGPEQTPEYTPVFSLGKRGCVLRFRAVLLDVLVIEIGENSRYTQAIRVILSLDYSIPVVRSIGGYPEWVRIVTEPRVFSVKLPAAEAEAVDAVVEESGDLQSVIHRRMIRYYLEENPDGWSVLQ